MSTLAIKPSIIIQQVLEYYRGLSPLRKFAWITAAFILLMGFYLTIRRFVFGLGAVTNLSDEFPWGFWIAFDVLGGVALAAGGFTLCCLVYVFGYHRYHSIVRPTVLTAFLGYVLVSIGLIYDLGKYYNIWHPLVMWNPHSVMFEVAWCVMLYSIVLFLEFLPVVLEKFKLNTPLKFMQKIAIPLVITGVLLSTLHQSSLGSVFLIVPAKLNALWYTPILPLLFFLSAVAVGPAMVIIESYFSARMFRKGLEIHILKDLAMFLQVALLVYVGVKVQDIYVRGVVSEVFSGNFEGYHFMGEIGLLIAAMVMLAFKEVRNSKVWLPVASGLVVVGILYNRFNVGWTGLARWTGAGYVPAWSEIGVSLFLVTAGIIVFFAIAKFFPIFPELEHEHEEEQKIAPRKRKEPTFADETNGKRKVTSEILTNKEI